MYTNKNQLRQQQRGYSLVELSIALAIIAVIIVGGLIGTRQILLTNSVNNQLKESAQTITRITKQFQRQTTTAGATTATLAPLGYWPSERVTNTGGVWTVRGAIGGSNEYVFTNDATVGTLRPNQALVYTIRNVPSAGCSDLANGLDSLAYTLYAGPAAAAAPTAGATPPPGLTEIKAPDSDALSTDRLATGCATTNPLVDVVAVIKVL